MPPSPRDERPPLVVAMQWVSQITSVSLTMVLPAVAGYWGDWALGTGPWLLVAGALLGTTLGMLQLLQLVSGRPKRPPGE